MSGLDIEKLLDETAGNEKNPNGLSDSPGQSGRREQDGHRDGKGRSERDGDSRRRSRDDDPDRDRHHRRDSYRGGGSRRSRSRSPTGTRHYRPPGRGDRDDRRGGRDDRRGGRDDDRRDRDRDYRTRDRERGIKREPNDRDRPRDRDGDIRMHDAGRRRSRSPKKEPQLTEDERDRRTIFVQQLAARLRSRDLVKFFEQAGPVQEAQIVKDRISNRSKGVGYVEFKDEESVPKAIKLTGHLLLGIPIIAQHTEAEKNRQVKTAEGGDGNTNGVPFHRLYVGNVHFSITEEDLENVFNPFGELEFVQLQKDDNNRSRGYGFVQFRDPAAAKAALESMNGFQLANRPIRVGLGNDRFTAESTASMLQRFPSQAQANFQGSAFSGSGGRGSQAGGSGGAFDRASGRDSDKAGGASALDDTDVGGVNYANYSRDALMRKLARTDDPTDAEQSKVQQAAKAKAAAKQQQPRPTMASRCVVVKNCFNAQEETGDSWVKDLEDEVRIECEDKYGHVVHLAADPNTDGDIYVKFDGVKGGENAIRGLNGRYFGGKTLSAQAVVDAVYHSHYPKAA